MSLQEVFSKLTDPRRRVGMRTDLSQILSMVVMSYLCGYTGYRPIKRFCEAHSATLIAGLSLRHGIPSHVTFHTILSHLSEAEMIAAFNEWSAAYVPLEATDWVSGDGKTLGSTVVNPHSPLQNFEAVVSLFCHKSGLVKSLGHYRNKDKESGELDMVRFLVSQLAEMGVTIRLDALHTQKKRLS